MGVPAVINAMNRANLRKVRRGGTRRHVFDAKYESYYGEAHLMNIKLVILTLADKRPLFSGGLLNMNWVT